jgi:putative transposase
MSTYTRIIYQIVFSTKFRAPTLLKNNRDELYKYIWGILSEKKCHLYRIGGVEDHIHILSDLPTTIALSNLVKDIKLASTVHIKANNLFPNFGGWQNGFGAFTYSIREKDILIEYIKNQEEHHRKKTYKEEYIRLLKEHEVEFEEKYLK